MNDAQNFLLGYDAELPLEVSYEPSAGEGGVEERVLSYLSSGPVRVPAVMARPVAGAAAAILVQHGGSQSKDDPLIRMVLRRWAAAGFLCLAIDAPGHGERASGSTVPRRGLLEYTRQRIQNAIDLRRAIDVVQQDYAGIERFGYWGVSMGGGVGVMLMASDSRVDAGCLCLAGARSRRTWPRADAANVEFVAHNLDPIVLAQQLVGRPVLMLNGLSDKTVPEEDGRHLFDALPEPKDQRWFRTGHKVTPEMLRVSREFFERMLRPGRAGD
jgi:dienelactone hydrolase